MKADCSKALFNEAHSLSARSTPVFEVEFADDAYSGGHVADVLAAFKAGSCSRY